MYRLKRWWKFKKYKFLDNLGFKTYGFKLHETRVEIFDLKRKIDNLIIAINIIDDSVKECLDLLQTTYIHLDFSNHQEKREGYTLQELINKYGRKE